MTSIKLYQIFLELINISGLTKYNKKLYNMISESYNLAILTIKKKFVGRFHKFD